MSRSSSLSEYNRQTFSARVFEARESRLRKAMEMLAAESVRGRALDIAAGSGIATEMLCAQGWEVSAVELSEELAQQIRARGIEDVCLHDISSGPLPFDDGTFRAVFAGEIIEHLVDTGAFLDDIRRVLVPGGVVVITTPNLASLENRLRLLFGIYPKWVEYDLSDQGHVRAYTLRTLKKHLRAKAFRIEDRRGNWVPVVPQRIFHDVIWPPIARTGDWFPGLSQGLIVKARLLAQPSRP